MRQFCSKTQNVIAYIPSTLSRIVIQKYRQRNLEIEFFCILCVCAQSLSPVWLFVTPWLFCPWDSPGKDAGVGCQAFLQRVFLTQGSNPSLLQLLHCRRILYHWGTGEAPLKESGSLLIQRQFWSREGHHLICASVRSVWLLFGD